MIRRSLKSQKRGTLLRPRWWHDLHTIYGISSTSFSWKCSRCRSKNDKIQLLAYYLPI